MHDQFTETVDRPLRNIGAPPAHPLGTVVDHRYEIVRVLGYGGSAVVYAARDVKLKQDVALKILRTDRLTETAVKRLRREVSIARRADNPRLIRVFDIAESAEGTYLTMELFDAPTLRTWMQGRVVSIEEIIQIALQIVEAIGALHALGIVHRDIKPSNLLVGANGEVKLGDFGLALHLDADESRLTQTAGLVGTLEYLSPEQALGTAVDQRSDLYSLGILLFEMVTGNVPFGSQSSIGTVVAHVNRPALDVRKFRPETPRWLARAIAGLLEKEPSRRFPDAASVRGILDRRRLPLGLALPWVRVAAAVVVIASLAVASGYFWWNHRFARLVNDGNTTLSALDRGGRTLWFVHDVLQPFNVAMVRQHGRTRYVAIIHDTGRFSDLSHNHDLTLVDPQDGRILRRVRLPDDAGSFEDFSRNFHATAIAAVDLEGNGNDVVVASYTHDVYWPSYTVIYDPNSQLIGTLFFGSGHHRYVGAVDVNGDGRKDLILAGINNRMGWFSAVAAVDVKVRTKRTTTYEMASSPDAEYVPVGSRALLWYSLLPAGNNARIGVPDPQRGRIPVEYDDGRVEWIDYNGFPFRQYRAPLADRKTHRWAAFTDLRDANRLESGGFIADAVLAAQRAYRNASLSEDPYLSEWSQRVYAVTLVKAGRIEEAERQFQLAMASSSSPTEVAFDAGKSFHLAGALDRAVRWYNRGMGVHSSVQRGRVRFEYLEGEVLALGEMERWNDALSAIRRFDAEFSERPYPEVLREYVQWRTGQTIERPVELGDSTTDLARYWHLEVLHRNGMPSAALLEAIDRERRRASGDTLLLSLRSEVLAQLGRVDEAYEDARKSFQEALITRSSDTAIRGHFQLIATRFITRARASGRHKEEQDAEAQLRAVQR